MAGGSPDASVFGIALPYCTPDAGAGTVANGQGCCRDYECESAHCFGFPLAGPGRRCVPATVFAGPDDYCGDERDCDPNQQLACDLRFDAGRCVTSFPTPFGNPCAPALTGPDFYRSCAIGGDGVCSLPGKPSQTGGPTDPCCYDRLNDGGLSNCLATETCSCSDAGGCGATGSAYVCPF